MKMLGLADRAWLLIESHRTPMHVAGFATFELPEDSEPDFVARLVARLREQTTVAEPWSWRLPGRVPAVVAPGWVEDASVDLDYHFRASALPHPGGERELGILISRLHSNPLDLERPPWEIHVIEGLSGGRFAIYMKIHHALIDGVSGMRLLLRMTSPDPDGELVAPWTISRLPPRPARAEQPTVATRLTNTVMGQIRSAARLSGDLLTQPAAFVPSTAPRSMLENSMNQQRRVATQVVSLEAVKAVAEAQQATVNDVVLHLCGGALRRFLVESGHLPDRSMVAAVPMSLREPGDERIGTNIAMLSMPLGTHIEDPVARLAHISATGREAKSTARRLGPEAQLARMAITASPVGLAQILPSWAQVPQTFNVGVSNVPGPAHPVYVAGARMLGLFPASLLMHGGALNITCVSYDGNLDFGFTGARDVLPHLQRLAVHLGDVAAEMKSDFLD